MADKTTLKASCHCKASRLSFTVPTSSLPLPAYFCHCGVCRRTHGTLCTIHAPIPKPEVDLSTFTAYDSSAKLQKFFCSTCGAHMLDTAREADGRSWFVEISMVEAAEDTWKLDGHYFLESTLDGGMSVWLPEIGGKRMTKWERDFNNKPDFAQIGDYSKPPAVTQTVSKKEEKLKARCHCGGVEFYIASPRGDEAHQGLPQDMTPQDKKKWYAVLDACNSCRLVSGCAIVGWAFPEASHVTLADGLSYKPLFGTLKSYKSSPEVGRTFCGTCGAVATYACADRPGYVDVAVGLLDAESGVRAEDWLEWRTHKMAFDEDCIWESFKQSMTMGLKNYGEHTSKV